MARTHNVIEHSCFGTHGILDRCKANALLENMVTFTLTPPYTVIISRSVLPLNCNAHCRTRKILVDLQRSALRRHEWAKSASMVL